MNKGFVAEIFSVPLAALRRRRADRRAAESLYAAAMDQARQPVFYASWGVPDTPAGRLEMLLLHVFLIWNRIEDQAGHDRRLGQFLFDSTFRNLDISLRNMGIGDLSVPRHVKRAMKAFKGRALAYRAALAADDQGALTATLRRNVYGADSPAADAGAPALAGYTAACAISLSAQSGDRIRQGYVVFGDHENDTEKQNRADTRMVA